jgi:hypothetical protein
LIKIPVLPACPSFFKSVYWQFKSFTLSFQTCIYPALISPNIQQLTVAYVILASYMDGMFQYFSLLNVFLYENRTMKPVEIVLRRGERWGRMMEGVNLRYFVNAYVNLTIYPPVQLLYVKKQIFTRFSCNNPS